MRPNLVIVRAGDHSLHPAWLDEERNFDLVLSYYGDNPHKFAGQYDMLHRCKGSKWEGISDFFSTRQNKIIAEKYEHVWLPDDDISTNSRDINKLFELVGSYDLALSQPSLKDESYVSWEITRQNKNYFCRFTSFVEIMVPCFQVKHLSLFYSTFAENRSGFGLEWLWSRIASDANLKMGIIDEVAVHHTRPVGSADRGTGDALPASEMGVLLNKHSIISTFPKVTGYYRNSLIYDRPTLGRNFPCPCGSQKKFKHCCGKLR